jgi:YHS domain-containing protein
MFTKGYAEGMKLIVTAVLFAGLAGVTATSMLAQDKKTDQKAVPKEASDPVCGMTVDPKTSEKADYKGKTYYFCSEDDKNTFLKAPDKFIAKTDGKKQ